MNRRSFIKNTLLATIGTLFIPQFLPGEQEYWGKSFSKPLERSLQYKEIGKKLLDPQQLPQGALARYQMDVASVSYVVSRRKA